MQRAPAQRAASWKRPRRGVYPVLDCRDPGNAVGCRQIIGQPFYNYGIAAKRQMGTVLLGRADRNYESRAHPEALAHRDGGHFFQPPGALLLSHRTQSWVVVVLGATGAAAEWLRQPSSLWVAVGWACVVAAFASLYPFLGWRRRGLMAASWPRWRLPYGDAASTSPASRPAGRDEREDRVTAASRRLAGDLRSVLHRAERLAAAAVRSSSDRPSRRPSDAGSTGAGRRTRDERRRVRPTRRTRGPGRDDTGYRREAKATRSPRGPVDITSCSRHGATRRMAALRLPACSSGLIRRFLTGAAAWPSCSGQSTEVGLAVYPAGCGARQP